VYKNSSINALSKVKDLGVEISVGLNADLYGSLVNTSYKALILALNIYDLVLISSN
jgi:hypothetical protein